MNTVAPLRILRFAIPLFIASATAHAAGGLNLSWSDCGAFGTVQRNFVAGGCSPGIGSIMIASAIPPVEMQQLNGMSAVVDLQTNQPTLSPWWQMGPGECRQGRLSAGFDFTGGPFSCADPWLGEVLGGSTYTTGFGGPNRARVAIFSSMPGTTLLNTVESYFFRLILSYAKTTGTGACTGYADGACIVFQTLNLTQPSGVGDYSVGNPLVRNFVYWQAGGSGVSGGCPGATATRTATWGSLKSLYR